MYINGSLNKFVAGFNIRFVCPFAATGGLFHPHGAP